MFSSLPPEVLIRIFKDLRDWEEWLPERDVLESGKIEYHLGWLSVTHVCRKWREVAFDPSLWTESMIDVLSTHPNYIPAILERADPLPLDIQVEYEDSFEDISEDPGLHAWLSPEVLRRVESFSVEGERGLFEFALSRLPDDLSHLKKLFISVNNDEGMITLPARFADLDHIEMLWLESCDIPWSSTIYSHKLTYLHLRGTGHELAKTYTEFNDLVARLPQLESLHLINFVPIPSTDAAPHGHTVILPPPFRFLEFIVTKRDMLGGGISFLSDLCAPSTCIRQIQLLNIPDTMANTSSFDTSLRAMLNRIFVTDQQGFVPVALEMSDNCVSVRSADKQTLDGVYKWICELSATKDRPDSTVCLRPDYDGPTLIQYKLLTYLPMVVLENLYRIWLTPSAIHAIDALDIWSHLSAAVNVRQIDIEIGPFDSANSDCSPVLDCLRQENTAKSDSSLFFPRLEVIAFHLPKDDDKPEWLNAIVDVVHARKKRGSPLREVLTPDHLAHLRVWDTLRADVAVSTM